MDEQERNGHLATLRETPAKLKAALDGVPKKLLVWTPAPGKWSILEIACHMRDMEQDAYLARYRRILAEDDPVLPDVDGDVYALERDYRSQRAGEALRAWVRLRRECLEVLGAVRGEQWARAGTHETAGRLTLADFLRRQAVGNDLAHLGQIDGIKRRWDVLSQLVPAPSRLAEATRGLSDEALRRQPAPGKWSIVEIACHLRDVERVYAERFTKMAHQDRPQLWMTDNDRLSALRKYGEAPLAPVLKEFRAAREDTLSLLRALPHPVWQRTGLHPKRGEETIEQMARALGRHDASHLQAIHSLRPG